jgi:hypothetical protein
MKKQETFDQLIDRLADFSGLGWMRQDGVCLTKVMAIYDVREHLKLCQKGYEAHYAGCARAALEELDKFDSGESPTANQACNQQYGADVIWSDTERQLWQPTEQDYRECCGVWVIGGVRTRNCAPEDLLYFESRYNFDRFHEENVRIEPMPEQCIPKSESKEKYNVPFPLMRGDV